MCSVNYKQEMTDAIINEVLEAHLSGFDQWGDVCEFDLYCRNMLKEMFIDDRFMNASEESLKLDVIEYIRSEEWYHSWFVQWLENREINVYEMLEDFSLFYEAICKYYIEEEIRTYDIYYCFVESLEKEYNAIEFQVKLMDAA